MRYLWVVLAATIAGCAQGGKTLPDAPGLAIRAPQSPLSPTTAKWYVDGVHGRNRNDCKAPQHACKTIHHAIVLSSPGDFIFVAAGTYFENLNIPFSLKIIGAGPASTILDGRRLASVFIIGHRNSDVTLSGMTIRNGGGIGDGGAVYNCFTRNVTIANSVLTGNSASKGPPGAAGFGGAIYNCPTTGTKLTIANSTLSNNTAEEGGAICSGGTLIIVNSTFYGNLARDRRGGAIRNYGILTITNSTFSGNNASRGIGGAIHNGKYIGFTGSLVMNSSTVAGNNGGGIYDRPGVPATFRNTIVANNAGGNCLGVLTSAGYNLSSDGTCTFNKKGDLNNTNPRLTPLQDNGGPTLTMALRPNSPAVDAGNPNGCRSGGQLLTTDQRGRPRPDAEDSSGCDIGAYELQDGH